MREDLTEQRLRGHWQKDKADRGVFRRGKIWYIRYADPQGRVRAERVGPSKNLALKVYQKRKMEVAERRFFPASGVSFEEIMDDAILLARESFKIRHPGKRFRPGNYEIVKEWFVGRSADTITPSEIAAKLTAHTQIPATFNRFRVAISHAYKIAVENKKVSENPGRLVKLQKENNERVRYLNQFSQKGKQSEETRLRDAVSKMFPAKEPEIDLALHTGMRWGEQYGLIWPHVDLTRNVIKIVHPKGGKDQSIPINAEARRALLRLEALAPQSEFVCPENNYDLHRDWWLAALKAAAIEDFHWHDLRHTFASRLVMNGVDIFTVCRLMRHQSIQITMRYAHLADKHLADAIAKLTSGVTTSGTARQTSPARPRYIQ